MKNRVFAIASMLVLIAAGSALAGDIYKWTDEDGNVHYGDRPLGDQTERVGIVSRPTDNARVQAATRASTDARAADADARAAAEAEGPTKEELLTEAAERAQKCTSFRERMQTLVASRRIYREDEQGERVYLNEDESLAVRERVENQIAEFCSS